MCFIYFNFVQQRHNRDIRSSKNWNFVFPLHFSYLPAMPILLSRPFRVSNLSKQPAPWWRTSRVQSPGGGVHCGFGKKRIMWQGLLAANVIDLLRQMQADTSLFCARTEYLKPRISRKAHTCSNIKVIQRASDLIPAFFGYVRIYFGGFRTGMAQ